MRTGIALCIAIAIAVCATPAAAERYIPTLHGGDLAPATTLFDQTGSPRSLARIGAPAVIAFIYTRCPDPRMCPLVTAKFGRMQRLLRDTPVRLIEITLDPHFDVPSVLARYGRAAGADPRRWWLLGGPPLDVDEVVDRFGIATERTQPGLVVHSEAVIVLDATGRIATEVDGNDWTPDEIAAEARSIAALRGDPLQRLALRLFGEVAALCGARTSGGLPAGALIAIFLVLLVAMGLAARRMLRDAMMGDRS